MEAVREIMTPEQVADYLQLNKETVYRYIREGKLVASRLGRSYRIPKANVDLLLLVHGTFSSPVAWAEMLNTLQGVAGTFGGVANHPADEVGTKFEYEQAETSFCRSTMTFRIQYQSRADDAEAVA